jgi:hypothetical protein
MTFVQIPTEETIFHALFIWIKSWKQNHALLHVQTKFDNKSAEIQSPDKKINSPDNDLVCEISFSSYPFFDVASHVGHNPPWVKSNNRNTVVD